VDASFGQEAALSEFRLDEERLQNLTKVVKFLEAQNYKIEPGKGEDAKVAVI
jgi:hypothetical protein